MTMPITERKKNLLIAKGLLIAAKQCLGEATYYADCLVAADTAQANEEINNLITKVSVAVEDIKYE